MGMYLMLCYVICLNLAVASRYASLKHAIVNFLFLYLILSSILGMSDFYLGI